MNFTQYIKYTNEQTIKYEYFDRSKEEMIKTLKDDLKERRILSTWLEDENGKELAYFDGHIQLIKGEKELKKATKKEVLDEIDCRVLVNKIEIRAVLDSLEERGYIKFKKELKTYKVFVKIATIGGENKKLYYITDFHLTENIDEAKRFELYEEKDDYAYEYVKEY